MVTVKWEILSDEHNDRPFLLEKLISFLLKKLSVNHTFYINYN
jgi:hypothetical protein